jgi:predicted exporter/lauroyl/myristoyl acyltransferase
VLLVCVALGFWRLRFDPEILELLPADEPTVQGLKLYQEHFTNARELIITLRSDDAGTTEAAAHSLATVLRGETGLVESAASQPPWMERPGQLAEMLACIWFNQPPEAFQSLSNKIAGENLAETLRATKEALACSLSPMDLTRRAFDPFDLLNPPTGAGFGADSFERGERLFATKDGKYRLLFARSKSDLGDYRACAEWLAAVRKEVDAWRARDAAWGTVRIRFTGRPVFVNEVASGMQKDLGGSTTGTALIIALLFWIAHRRLLPMFWTLGLLGFILVATIALGGLVFGGVKVISMAFAAVLLGLAVDYAMVLYQEALAHPGMSARAIRQTVQPGIFWAAATTICAFLVLNLGGLPGLAQLGTLVAIGVALAAWVMLEWFLPLLFRNRPASADSTETPGFWSGLFPPAQEPVCGATVARGLAPALGITVAALLIAICIVLIKAPALDATAGALQLQNSEAQSAIDEMTREMEIPSDALWLIARGESEKEVLGKLEASERVLAEAQTNGIVTGWFLPTSLWPRVEHQEANRAGAAWLGRQAPRLRQAAASEGFNSEALMMTEELLRAWQRAGVADGAVWPTNDTSQWLLERAVSRSDGAFYALGLVYPARGTNSAPALRRLSGELSGHDVLVSGWGMLGGATLEHVRERAWRVIVPMVLLVLLSLWLAFRRGLEVMLGIATLGLSGLIMVAVMAALGWSWNLLNLMALPLVIGAGVDYGIHMQCALRRSGGDIAAARRSMGKALLLCGGTTIAGFGSLAWAGNAGIASFGKVCAAGITANMIVAVYLLPSWWLWFSARGAAPASSSERTSQAGAPRRLLNPSLFYRPSVWRLGLALVRLTPVWFLEKLFLAIAEVYYRMNPHRREIVIANLLPALQGDREAARRAAHRLFREFALKLLGLMRFESGVCDPSWFTAGIDWANLENAIAKRKGVLLVTPHLGNWEIGGALLAQRGIKLVVLTQAEPGAGFTEMRTEARARWGIETFVVGGDGFGFVEIIKRLNQGQNIAVLIDRPPAAKSVTVELFGRDFGVSIAPAELARATGCVVLGVTLVRTAGGYGAKIMSEFEYDRRALGGREARRDFMQQIMRGLEPEIAAHPDQWFHFVPVWPDDQRAKPPPAG